VEVALDELSDLELTWIEETNAKARIRAGATVEEVRARLLAERAEDEVEKAAIQEEEAAIQFVQSR